MMDGLMGYYTNSQSLGNKMDLLRGKASAEKFYILAIMETWMDIANKIFLSEFEIDSYQIFHNNRKGRKGGSGSMLRETQFYLN